MASGDNTYFNCKNQLLVICNKETFENIKKFVKLLILFLKEVSFLTEAYVLDYFVEKLWTKFPNSWQKTVEDFEPGDLEAFLTRESKIRYQHPWPLSLLSFRACAFVFSLPRNPIESSEPITKFIAENINLCDKTYENNSTLNKKTWGWSNHEFEENSGQHKHIPEFCRRHVKPKKQHEIYRLAQVTDTVSRPMGANHVVDIGSGQGHLSRLLALCYEMQVATVEANEFHVMGAVNFDKQALSSFKRVKQQGNDDSSTYNEQTLPLHLEGTMTLETSEDYLKKIFNHARSLNSSGIPNKFTILGLHTCGDLASTIMKLFLHCEQARALLSVGCCYMKLNTTESEEGYPLSAYVKSLPYHSLSYEAREMACHALEMYVKRLKDNAPSLKIHCYRATLEKCIVHHHPEWKHMGLRGVKNAELLEFSSYAEKALKKINHSIPKDFFSQPEVQSCLKQWKNVLIFYSLRLIVAPVIESLILLDRLLYLYERGNPSCLAPLFDPSISPRNHVIISAKCNV